mgnify:CR=1 FL=1|tara:strand:+ start:1316 stop:1744 length:429 start_codon:yes stop_codon:yes gene_type:complete
MTVDDKIKQIRTMARKIEACMYASSNGDYLVDRIKSQIMDMETRHRRGVEFGRYRSKPIAVDLFLVKTIADAVEVLTVAGKGKRLRKTLPISKMCVREDYLTARQLVAQEFAILFDRKKGIKRPELMRVAEMCDYTDIVTTK